MRSAFLALTWEILRQSPRLIWSMVGILSLVVGVGQFVSDRAGALENLEPYLWLLMVITLFMIFGIFHHAEHNRQRDWHGFPYRLFVLPVSTLELIGCPMLLGVMSVSAVYLIWAELVFAPLGRAISLRPALIISVGMICYQAIVWSLAAFRITRIVALAIAALVFMDIGFLQSYSQLTRWTREEVSCWTSWLLVALAFAGFLVGWYSVDKQRRGGGRGRGWWKAWIESLADAVPRRQKDFESPSAAQFWFEWRRSGWLLPISVAAALILVFGPVSWFLRKEADYTLWILGWTVALPLIMAAVIGKGFMKPDFWAADLSVPPFLAVRPISAEELVVTRMKVAAVSVVGAWVLVLGFLSVWLPGWANSSEPADLWVAFRTVRSPFTAGAILWLSLILGMILSWRCMIGSLWIGLRGSGMGYVTLIILQLAGLIVGIRFTVYVYHGFEWTLVEQYASWAGWLLVAAVASKLWLAAYSWRKISPRRAFRYALVWSGGTACTVTLVLLVCPGLFWIKYPLILAAMLPFPLACVGLAPDALARNRHR